MNRKNHASVVRLTSLALLAALVVVLQTVASGIRIGPVPISLTLVPIVVGAILFGPGAGAGLGAVFGVVCLIAGITGADRGPWILDDQLPQCRKITQRHARLMGLAMMRDVCQRLANHRREAA